MIWDNPLALEALALGDRTPLCCFSHLFPFPGPTKPHCVFLYMEEQKVWLKLTAEAQHDNKSPPGECMWQPILCPLHAFPQPFNCTVSTWSETIDHFICVSGSGSCGSQRIKEPIRAFWKTKLQLQGNHSTRTQQLVESWILRALELVFK